MPASSPAPSSADLPAPVCPSALAPLQGGISPSALAEGPDRTQILLRLLMLAALYTIPVLASLQPRADYDLWWHLRVGEWVVDHGTVPATDPLSAYGQGRPWIAYSWLFEVLMYVLYCALGLWGALAYQLILSLAVVGSLHRLVARRQPHFLIAVGLTGIATLAMAMLFKQRPWMLTILFSIWTLEVILSWREGRASWRAWLLPLVFLLWANIHIQVVYGLFLLTLACAAPLLDRWLGWGACQLQACSRSWWQLTLLTALCFLATLGTPYHLRLAGVVLEYATQSVPFTLVSELRALEFRETCDWVMLALVGCAVFALGRRPQLSSFDILLLMATAYLAFRARRDLWLLTTISTAILASAYRAPVLPADRFPLTFRRWSFVAGLVLLGGLAIAWARDLTPRALRQAIAREFPVEAARIVKERGYEGPLYNDFNWGGFFTWSLPHLPVSIDGRTNLHGEERLLRYANVWAGMPDWREDPELARAGVVITPLASPLGALLRTDDRFVQVHEDQRAMIFIARGQLIDEKQAERTRTITRALERAEMPPRESP